jgi:hypothetical protein
MARFWHTGKTLLSMPSPKVSIMIHAKLVKLKTLPDAEVLPDGAGDSKGPIVDGYEVMGFYRNEPKIGASFVIARYQRNKVVVNGIMMTSGVTEIVKKTKKSITFRTLNSIYKLIHLPDPKSDLTNHPFNI